MPISPSRGHATGARVRARAVGGLAVATLVLAGCGGGPSGQSTATTETTSAPTADEVARDLVSRQLDTEFADKGYEVLIVMAHGADVAAVFRAADTAGPYEALTTYRLEGGQLTGATRYRSTQKVGTGPLTPLYATTGNDDATSTEANKELVQTMYHEVIDLRQPDAPARHIAEGYIQHNPAVPQGRAGIEQFVQSMGPAAPGASTRQDALVLADGELVLLVSTLGAGTDRRIADLFRVEDGLVAEHWDFTPVT
jgi:predicted SnoaL-like aldol condensation-catalyzing enzyme